MRVNWGKAIWWIFFLASLYTLALYFMTGCARQRPLVYAAGIKVQHDEDSVLEPGMAPEEKER